MTMAEFLKKLFVTIAEDLNVPNNSNYATIIRQKGNGEGNTEYE